MAAIDYRQGQAHREAGIPCQNFGRLATIEEDTVIAVLADGAGTTLKSHIGARIAVDTALPLLKQRILEAPGTRGRVTSLTADVLFDGVLEEVLEVIQQRADHHHAALTDFACTLTAVAIAPAGLMAMQLGDGSVVARIGQEDYSLLMDPAPGYSEPDNIAYTTASEACDARKIAQINGPVRFVSATTDGLNAISLDEENTKPQTDFFEPIDRFTKTTDSPKEVHEGIREFLASDEVTNSIDSDTTLMICGWRPPYA